MAAELVNAATSEKLDEMDWNKNIQICELVAHDNRQARDVIKAIKKCLGSKNENSQLYAVMLLEMLMNNIGEQIHKQVIDVGVLPSLLKIVKKKSDLQVRERIFLLLDATQTSLGGASGKFPQYYTVYYDLVSAGIQFPQRPPVVPEPAKNNLPNRDERVAPQVEPHVVPRVEPRVAPESSIIQKASNVLEVLKEVLDAVDSQHPEAAKDEFTLDLVEQCSFQKQKVMHLVMTSRNEKVISQAIELNEKLQRVLTRYDALLSCNSTSTLHHLMEEQVEEEEEEPEQLVRRLRKGKACVRPEDEEQSTEHPCLGLLGLSNPGERLNRPLIRPLSLGPSPESNGHSPPVAVPPSHANPGERLNHPLICPLNLEPSPESNGHSPPVAVPPSHANPGERLNRPLIRPVSLEPSPKSTGHSPPFAIPPPPAKHVERERYFQETKVDGSSLAGHVRGLSLHSRNASSSLTGSMDFSD